MMTEQRKLPEAGPRKAYLNRYIKAGIHTVDGYQGAPDKDNPQVILGWELVEDMTDEETPRPMWVKGFGAGNINDFNGERAKKTSYFTSMFLDYNPEIGNGQDFLGRPCRVIIKHRTGKGAYSDRTFANLTDVRDYDGELPPISKPAVFFDFYNPTPESLNELFPWELEYLQEACDYSGSKLETMIEGSVSKEVVAETCDVDSDNVSY